jgi:hypothetical protein
MPIIYSVFDQIAQHLGYRILLTDMILKAQAFRLTCCIIECLKIFSENSLSSVLFLDGFWGFYGIIH